MNFLNFKTYIQVIYCLSWFLFGVFFFAFFLSLHALHIYLLQIFLFSKVLSIQEIFLSSALKFVESMHIWEHILWYIYILYDRQIASFLNEHIALSKSNYVFVTISFHCQSLLSVLCRPIEHGLSVKWSIAVRQFENKYHHPSRWNISNLVLISSTGFT